MRKLSTAPFIHTLRGTQYIYMCIALALIPPVIHAVFFYGLRALVLIVFSALLSLLLSGFVHGERDYGSVCEGVIFALMLPPGTSIITAAAGVFVAQLLVKRMFGGMGSYCFSPIAFARIFVEMAFPYDMGGFDSELGMRWFELESLFWLGGDGAGARISDYSMAELMAGRFSTFIGTGCALLIIIGMIFLLCSKSVGMRAPLIFLVTTAVAHFVTDIDLGPTDSLVSTLVYMMTSGILFVAAYLMTDPVTVAAYGWASVVEGVMAGIALPVISTKCSPIIAMCVTVIVVNLFDLTVRYFSDIMRRCRKAGDA